MEVNFYKAVMDDSVNPFSKLPKVVRFQLMTALAYMWCAIFSFMVGSYAFFGVSAILHFAFLLGVFITADLFRKALKDNSNEYFLD